LLKKLVLISLLESVSRGWSPLDGKHNKNLIQMVRSKVHSYIGIIIIFGRIKWDAFVYRISGRFKKIIIAKGINVTLVTPQINK